MAKGEKESFDFTQCKYCEECKLSKAADKLRKGRIKSGVRFENYIKALKNEAGPNSIGEIIEEKDEITVLCSGNERKIPPFNSQFLTPEGQIIFYKKK